MEIPIDDGESEKDARATNIAEDAALNGGTAASDTAQEPLDPLEQAKEREKELIDSLQRLAADFDNYRKKNAGEFSRGMLEGQARAIESILPVLDSLGLAIASATAATDVESLRKGVEAVQRQLLGQLGALGLEEIHASAGDALDPNIHEVLLTEQVDGIEPGRVTGAFQIGYRFKSRLLRAAKVKVAAEKPVASMPEKANGGA